MKRKRTLGMPLAALLIGGVAASNPSASRAAQVAASAGSMIAPAAVTVTRIVTATASPRPTATATASPRPTATATSSPTPTATATASPAPTATATASPAPTATATASPAPTLTITPPTTNRGGIVTVSGTGFLPHEIVRLTISNGSGVVVRARATASGLLPPTGLSIPYRLRAGKSYTIRAIGNTSRRTATTTVRVQALSPRISLSPTTVQRGTTATVHGTGFGRQERVTLALNGQALVTSPKVIRTVNGAFTASFSVPSSLLRGANTVSAVGNESRVSTVATLTGQLARSAQFYFAGGINTATTHSFVDVLNTNGQPTSVRLTFYFDNGGSYTRLVTVGATSQRAIALTDLGGLPQGIFGVQLKADRRVAAQLTVNRNGQDGGTLLGTPGLDSLWYLASGSTSGTFHETVSILNPNNSGSINVQLQLFHGAGQPTTTMYASIPAHTNYVADINKLLPNRHTVSIEVRSSNPVVVERTLTFGPNGDGMTMLGGALTAATNWLFASGTTENGVQTIFTVLNPGDYPAQVTASFFNQGAGALGNQTIDVPPRSPVTLRLNDVVHNVGGISTLVTSNQAVIVSRAEYIGVPNQAKAGSDVLGRNGGAPRWTFPGGNTTPGYHEVLVLYNPAGVSVPVSLTFYDNNGHTVARSVTLTPSAYVIVPVNPVGVTTTHGEVVQATNGQGFIAEQSIITSPGNGSGLSLQATPGLAQ